MSKPLKSLSLFEDFLATPTFSKRDHTLKSMATESLGQLAIQAGVQALFRQLGYSERGLFPGLRFKLQSATNSAELLVVSNKLTAPKFSTTQLIYGDTGQAYRFKVRRMELLDRASLVHKTDLYELQLGYARYQLELEAVEAVSEDQWIIAADQQATIIDSILKQVAARYGIEPGNRVDNFQNLWDLWLTVLAN